MIALLATLSAVLLVVPSDSMYFVLLFDPLVPLLYLLDRPESTGFAIGTVLPTLTLKFDDVERGLGFAGAGQRRRSDRYTDGIYAREARPLGHAVAAVGGGLAVTWT
jgi:hypothetical protein